MKDLKRENRMSIARGTGLSAVLLAVAGCASSSPVERSPADVVPAALAASKSIEERLRFGIDARLKAGLGFGYLAAVRENGKTVAFADGRRMLEPMKPMVPRDSLEIGSVSKTFTGILLHLAEAEKRLGVDQRLEEILPVLRGSDAGGVTLRELGTHESGLPSFPYGVAVRDPANPWRDLSADSVLAALARYRRPPLPEGVKRKREYSNWGYLTLGMVLERVYGRPYAEVLKQHLLAPLRMTDTGIDRQSRPRRGKTVGKVAPGFSLDTDPIGAWDWAGFAAATGGIETNAVDMGRFLEALEHPPRGKLGEAIRATFASGIGWDSLPGERHPLWKNGMTGGYASYLAFDSESKTGLFVAVNAKVLPDAMGGFAIGIRPADRLLERVIGPRIASEEEIASLKGRYRNRDPKTPSELEIFESFGRIVARYRIAGRSDGARLGPAERPGVWNLIDGLYNVDEIRLRENAMAATMTDPSGSVQTFEMDKLPSEIQKFPAIDP